MSSTTVTLYSCPTGGWVMGNRFVLEDSIKKECGDQCVVKHKVGCILTATVVVDGESKTEFMPLAMITPLNACTKFIKAKSIGSSAKALFNAAGDAPVVAETPATVVPRQ